MYTRYPNYRFGSRVRLPENYSGNAFSAGGEALESANVESDTNDDNTADAVLSDNSEKNGDIDKGVAVIGGEEKKIKLPSFKLEVGKLFSGGFGFEELLIIALILLISGGDNDDGTILWLVLLLFIR
jgi:hypothetical protein